jgi:hypothetical protein
MNLHPPYYYGTLCQWHSAMVQHLTHLTEPPIEDCLEPLYSAQSSKPRPRAVAFFTLAVNWNPCRPSRPQRMVPFHVEVETVQPRMCGRNDVNLNPLHSSRYEDCRQPHSKGRRWASRCGIGCCWFDVEVHSAAGTCAFLTRHQHA